MNKNITVIRGDGIGPEIVAEALKVLGAVCERHGHTFHYTDILMGGASIDATGVPLTVEALKTAKNADAVLLGSVGGPKWDSLPGHLRPEAGLLAIRKGLGLLQIFVRRFFMMSCVRLVRCGMKLSATDLISSLCASSPAGFILVNGNRVKKDGVRYAKDTLVYSEEEIRRIAIKAFEIAEKRRGKVTSIDKANVLDSSRLWRAVVHEVAKDYPNVECVDMLVDNAAMQLVKDPKQFDVILTENMFGDILSDEASMVTGSIGMLASASLNETKFGLYEPSGGSAPDIAGQNKANPIATILSAAMMLRYSFDLDEEADEIESAVKKVLAQGYRTGDIMSDGCRLVSCTEMGDLIKNAL